MCIIYLFAEQRKLWLLLLFFNFCIFLFAEGLWLGSIIHFERGGEATLQGFEIGGITEPYAICASVSAIYLIWGCRGKLDLFDIAAY